MGYNMGYYRLNGRKVELAALKMDDLPPDELKALWDMSARRVALDEPGPYRVSTVFLVVDHGYGGEPMLFETLSAFGSEEPFIERCGTCDEAEAMHAAAVARMQARANGE